MAFTEESCIWLMIPQMDLNRSKWNIIIADVNVTHSHCVIW